MSSTKRPVLLLTRPPQDSRRFAAMLPDWPAVISPILRIVAVDHDAAALRDAPGLVCTSAHAVPAAGPGRGRLALCVGGHTGLNFSPSRVLSPLVILSGRSSSVAVGTHL